MTEDNDQVSDPAERLHSLCVAIQEAVGNITVDGKAGRNLPLWQAFDPISAEMGMEDYAELRDNLLLLATRVAADIERLSLGKASVRTNWQSAVAKVSSVLDAKHFGTQTSAVLKECFTPYNLQTLEAISERLQAHGWRESSEATLHEAFNAMRETIDAYAQDGRLPSDVVRLLKHLQGQMEQALNAYEVFGEERFWQKYKEAFATFAQIHDTVGESVHGDELNGKIANVRKFMATAFVRGAGIATFGANMATIATFGSPLLIGYNDPKS